MKNIRTKLKDQGGFSFLEVMIALVMMGVITASIFELYIRQHKNYMVQDDITVIQQNARASLDEMGRHIRMAGYDIPYCLSAIVPSNTNPDTLTLVYRVGDCETYLLNDMGSTSSELECATDVSCFEDNQWVYIFEPDSGGGEWFQINTIEAGDMNIFPSANLSKVYNKDAIVITLSQMKFYINNTSDPDHPSLMVERFGQPAQIYAEDIESLQFSYRLKNGYVFDEPVLIEAVREVVISVVSRSGTPDSDGTYEYKVVSDGEGEPSIVNDEYRHRTYSTSVNLRNLGN